MPVRARRLIRRMRGGAQAHLLEAEDGFHYVVKFRNNPQHRRILVNEWIASTFFRFLRVSSAPPAFIEISEEFLRENPEVYIEAGRERRPVTPGWHYGSRFPGDPARLAVYDFLPDAVLEGVLNLREFLGALVIDKWMANADSRQAVYFRASVEAWSAAGASPRSQGFVAWMIDHGFVFTGPHWRFDDGPLQGLYLRPRVYADVRGLDDLQPWLDRVRNFPEEVVDQALREIPPQWLNGDLDPLEEVLERLMRRRRRVADLIADCARGRAKDAFPKWK
jgi:hypothetical protein